VFKDFVDLNISFESIHYFDDDERGKLIIANLSYHFRTE